MATYTHGPFTNVHYGLTWHHIHIIYIHVHCVSQCIVFRFVFLHCLSSTLRLLHIVSKYY